MEFPKRSLLWIYQDTKVFLRKYWKYIILSKEFHNLFQNQEAEKCPTNVAFDEMTYCWSKSVSGNYNWFIVF